MARRLVRWRDSVSDDRGATTMNLRPDYDDRGSGPD